MEAIGDREIGLHEEPDELSSLPITPFERFMVEDDQPAYPKTYYFELAFAGRVDPVILRDAASAAIRRNPLLRAKLVRDRTAMHWRLDTEPDVRIDQAAFDAPVAPPGGAVIDLEAEHGVRLWWACENDRSKVWIQLHHACADGQGARRFCVDLLVGYARFSGDEKPKWDRLDVARLHDRSVYSQTSVAPRTGAWDRARYAFDFHCRKPLPLAVPRVIARRTTSQSPVLVWHAFSPEETSRIRQRARDEDVTLNDVGMTLLFHILADWNRERGNARDDQRLRILMPADMRTGADVRLPAANRMGFAFLTRRVGDCGDLESLLRGIREETVYIKSTRIALDFVESLGVVCRFPRLLPLMLRLSGCMATAVLTNLDDPARRILRKFRVHDGLLVSGNLCLQRICVVPPIRTGTRAGFGICTYGRQLTLGLNADPSCFDMTAAQQLLAAYAQEWRQWSTASVEAPFSRDAA